MSGFSQAGLILTAPCSRVDLGEVYGDLSPFVWVVACRQIALGPSYAISGPDGRALFVGGFVPMAEAWECWFHAAPAAAPHMVALRRLARLTLLDLPQSDPRPVETAVRTPAGARIARMLGFRQVLVTDGLDIWRWERWATP
ncbi:hypothetical protein [Ancylobacter sp. SL191]|uniref:hypothetical protein n=1 Tax=Ancylobacter sp. SL191 TaxID=2995166 RepID=UPI00226D6114|nr:hypothetical protein [Ancylobacter sp. SL191]WAC26332.1 hypothetical protein OU996_15100 [Ancylobacter sp. SL191]